MGISSTLPGVISERMDKAGISLGALAHRTGIPKTTLHNRLNGDTRLTVSEMERIAAALRVKVSTITRDAEMRTRRSDAA
jgi:transcriptional regulator with XRE-family HTH domain